MTLIQGIDPRTGRPEPDAMQHFLAAHPESAPFFEWAKTAPWTASYADQTYNSLNAFHFIDAGGHGRLVRWSMHPIEPLHDVLQAELARHVVLKYAPHLVFHLDESIERGTRIIEILQELETHQPETE